MPFKYKLTPSVSRADRPLYQAEQCSKHGLHDLAGARRRTTAREEGLGAAVAIGAA
jgi:hypothetical protein